MSMRVCIGLARLVSEVGSRMHFIDLSKPFLIQMLVEILASIRVKALVEIMCKETIPVWLTASEF